MKLAVVLVGAFLAATSAVAQISWVASNGSDGNPCTRAQPCLTFQHAHDVTAAGGVVKAVDAADYGIIFITKAITIDGNGVGASIEANGFYGIHVTTTGGPTIIRDLTIHELGCGRSGIRSFADVHIENVLIVATCVGVDADGTNGTYLLTAKNLTVMTAVTGVYIHGTSANIRDSVMRGGQYGIQVFSIGAHATTALIERTELSGNSTAGLNVDNGFGGGAIARISDSVITGNALGISTTNGGQIITFRTNMLAGNTTDGSTPFSISLK
jgi:hypothetical protein